ncbi:MAG: DUF4446 family protein [Butyrivibrio sp.]
MTEFINMIKDNSAYIIIGLVVIIVILIVMVIYNAVNFNKLNKKYTSFLSGKDGENLEEVILTRFKEIDKLKVSDKINKKSIDAINEELLSTYKKIGIVKYDAFNEMGGKLSFALAMLDKSNNGFVMNAMHSREGCYTYIKEIVKGESYITLGEEEKTALEQAISSDSVVTD